MTDKIEEVKKILVEMKVYQKVYCKSKRPLVRDELARKLVDQLDQKPKSKFSNALEADAHNWDTREVEPEVDPVSGQELVEKIAKYLVDLKTIGTEVVLMIQKSGFNSPSEAAEAVKAERERIFREIESHLVDNLLVMNPSVNKWWEVLKSGQGKEKGCTS